MTTKPSLGKPGPASKRKNSGDTKGYPEEQPGRHKKTAGKAAKESDAAEKIPRRK